MTPLNFATLELIYTWSVGSVASISSISYIALFCLKYNVVV